jgi:hypothetical protein
VVSQPQIAGNQSKQQINLANFPIGSVVSGFIINRDAAGNPILRTDSGDIAFASNFFLKIGSEVTIRIEHLAGNTSAHLLTVNGQAPEIAVTQTAFTNEPEVIISGNLGDNLAKNVYNQASYNNNPIVYSANNSVNSTKFSL